MSFRLYQIQFSVSVFHFWLGVILLLLLGWLCVLSVRRSLRPVRTGFLEGLRFVCGALLVLLLWQPEWKRNTMPNYKPELVVLRDKSGSMETQDGVIFGSKEAISRDELVENVVSEVDWEGLKERAEMKVSFEDFSAPNAKGGLGGTNIGGALEEVLEGYKNLRAVVLLSDGDWNEGDTPVTVAQRYRLRDVPIYPVKVGSERRLPDLVIESVTAPAYGIIGEKVQIPFTVTSSLDREVRTTLFLRDEEGQEEVKEILVPARGSYSDAILWEVTNEGESRLKMTLPVERDELLHSNNEELFSLAGKPEAIKVLVIETLPRWEYRFIRNALYRDPGVTVDCLLLHPELGPGDGPAYIQEFPSRLEDLQKYDVVFVGDIGVGEGQLSKEQAELIKGLVENQASGVVFIPGSKGNQFSLKESALWDLMPVELDEKELEGFVESIPSPLTLTTEGKGSLLTLLADTMEENFAVWEALPGFHWHAPVVRSKSGTQVLAVHGNSRNNFGRIPLLVTQRYGNGKVLFMGTDSAWRWRKGVEDLYHYRFWGQVARWMSYRRNMAAGQRIRLYHSPERPKFGDYITFNANAFDENGAPLREGKVLIELLSPQGKKSLIELARREEAWGAYAGSFRVEEPGSWEVKAFPQKAEDAAVESTIIVRGGALEKVGLPLRAEVLDEVAEISGARSMEPGELERALQEIELLPKQTPRVTPFRIWAHWIAVVSLVVLLGLFWMGRKLNGVF